MNCMSSRALLRSSSMIRTLGMSHLKIALDCDLKSICGCVEHCSDRISVVHSQVMAQDFVDLMVSTAPFLADDRAVPSDQSSRAQGRTHGRETLTVHIRP